MFLQYGAVGDPQAQDLPPTEIPDTQDKDRGPVMPVPKGIRPTLSKHRVEASHNVQPCKPLNLVLEATVLV